MKNCSKCFWCRIAAHPKWIWKCKMGRKMLYKNYMNHPKLHGMFCKWYEPHEEVNADEEGSDSE